MSQTVAGLTTGNLGVTQGRGGVREPPSNFTVGVIHPSTVLRKQGGATSTQRPRWLLSYHPVSKAGEETARDGTLPTASL
jgi:hypothetical protein